MFFTQYFPHITQQDSNSQEERIVSLSDEAEIPTMQCILLTKMSRDCLHEDSYLVMCQLVVLTKIIKPNKLIMTQDCQRYW